MSDSDVFSLQYLENQRKYDALTAASIGVDIGREAASDAGTLGRGLVKGRIAKAVGKIALKEGASHAGEAVAEVLDPTRDWTFWTTTECECGERQWLFRY